MSTHEVRLTYFNGRGLAEDVRLVLAYAGVEYEDIRIEKTGDKFLLDDALKQSGALVFGQVPLLEYHGLKLVQSMAICRFLARTYDLYGATVEESALIDVVVEGANDLRGKWYTMNSAKEHKEPIDAEFYEKTLPLWLGHFEKLLAASGTGYFVGSKITFADIAAFNVFDLKPLRAGSFHAFPLINAFSKNIASEPKIAAWLAKRPLTKW
eukprot:TRINITY_DN476_c0_g2_i1.p1 TRINITY_DN476_c0_g2~~TRINITY_DN476_c0_g2_i1.p1  ORF type:complete len:223 (-),score=65.98 TRINITY_DN476_c0_g2_i1:194-823(-)